jgi:hypothetical protein
MPAVTKIIWHVPCISRGTVEEWDGGLGQLRAGASTAAASRDGVQQMSSRQQ